MKLNNKNNPILSFIHNHNFLFFCGPDYESESESDELLESDDDDDDDDDELLLLDDDYYDYSLFYKSFYNLFPRTFYY